VGIALAMTSYGYTLMGEGHDPRTLVRNAVRAEEEGFDFLVFSDHYHPWLPSQEHSPFVWSVLGAVAEATERIELATMVTCPIVRYHPAIIAQAAATIGVMSDGRFTLGLGTGERLNEHVVGAGWPPADVRQEMLAEAIEVMRRLWSGEYVSHRGPHFTVEDARIFDLPEEEIPVFVAAGGPQAARLAAEAGDGICATEPDPSLVETFAAAGGAHADTWGQLALSWHPGPGGRRRPCPRPVPLRRARLEGDGRAAEPGELRGGHRDRASGGRGRERPLRAGPRRPRRGDRRVRGRRLRAGGGGRRWRGHRGLLPVLDRRAAARAAVELLRHRRLIAG
jgi:G6PDH family F420-dependent oxidoreductase